VIPCFSKDGKFIRSFTVTASNLEATLQDSLFRSSMQIGQLVSIKQSIYQIIKKKRKRGMMSHHIDTLYRLLQDEINNRYRASHLHNKNRIQTESKTLTTIDWSALSLHSKKMEFCYLS